MANNHNETFGYVPIIKSVKQEDGTLMVYGNATDDSLDLDSQICDSSWLEKAMPDWFMSGGNIREMHDASAVGVAQEYELKDGQHIIGTHIVDPIAVLKVNTGVYKGFSIGIKNPQIIKDTSGKAVNGRIINGSIIEVSLVDRPANPNAKLIVGKSVNGDSTLTKVSEIYEYSAPLPTEVFKNIKKTEKGSTKMDTLKQIEELAKSLTATIVKSSDEHKAAYAMAVQGLTQLIALEATEQAAGSNESYDILLLSNSLDYLKSWGWNEVYDAANDSIDISILELKATPDLTKSKDAIVEEVPTVIETPVVEVPVVEDVTPVEVPEAVIPVAVELTEISVPEVTIDVVPEVSGEADVKTLVDEAVKSLLGEMKSEITAKFESAIKAVESDNTKLKSELETALNKVAGGGAKRTATKMSNKSQNDKLIQAEQYEMKASATTDKKAAEGYRDIAKSLRAESNQTN